MWKLSASDRLARWRDFRKSLATVPVDEAIEQTVQFWRSCPFTPFYLEARQPETWPSPWQLLDENYYCDLAKALGIVYTVHLIERPDIINMQLAQTQDGNDNLVQINQGKYILNMIDGQVLNINNFNKTFWIFYSCDSCHPADVFTIHR